MPCVIRNAFDANIFVICLAIEFERLVMHRAELVIVAELFFLAGELQCYKIFSKHIGFYLRVVFVAAGWAVEKLLLFINYHQTLFANSVATIQISWYFLLRII